MTMHEYVPRWIQSPISAESPSYVTDETDTSHSVSFVSDPTTRNRQHTPLRTRIIAVATVPAGQFDRALFDSLMASWEHSELLAERLADGWERIERAVADGQDIAAWESFWLELLGQYERACAGIPTEAAAGDQP